MKLAAEFLNGTAFGLPNLDLAKNLNNLLDTMFLTIFLLVLKILREVKIKEILGLHFVNPQFNNEVQHLGPSESGGYPKFNETILQAPVVSRT